MNQDNAASPTALDLSQAMARGRLERSRAFHTAMHMAGHWLIEAVQGLVSGGKPQVRPWPTRPALHRPTETQKAGVTAGLLMFDAGFKPGIGRRSPTW